MTTAAKPPAPRWQDAAGSHWIDLGPVRIDLFWCRSAECWRWIGGRMLPCASPWSRHLRDIDRAHVAVARRATLRQAIGEIAQHHHTLDDALAALGEVEADLVVVGNDS